ncbi:LamG domain-containing protein [Streptomyces sp. DG2A-72]|uniref:LamG domain-containing protein n=1 Tax=Streptomyces sp. DG2A-72 TaxID=3051386 RepID=UPI00265C733B|nr:LamG domain-containing protein [Streptomyces sp. DG2A-72]MDO0932944.1 LamG domain-containing protein [Streptomyces sp. DG2A-72]
MPQTPSEQAAATGEPVEVTAERTEYAQTFANPDGTYTLKQATAPERAKDASGEWHDIDTTLVRRADGTIGPRYVAVGQSFSAGGTKDMVRLEDDQRVLSVRWPGDLPEPSLEGATATYAEVMPGVDLQLTAMPDGYREVLRVKSAEAAQSEALEQLRFAVAGEGVSLVAGAGGGLRAVDADGNAVFTGPAGQMWDSAGDDSGVQAQTLRMSGIEAGSDTGEGVAAAADDGAPVEPGPGAATATLPVQVGDDSIAVTPDLSLLRGDSTVYPVYIDPSVGLSRAERTVLSSDGDKFYQFSGDYGVGRCAPADGYACDDDFTSNYANRMYFEFSPSALAGKHVLNATFRAYETWSFNCNPYTVKLERTGNISEGTRWPGPAIGALMDSRKVSAGRGGNCSPAQPDAWVEFNGGLTKTVRDFADGKFSRLTLMLRAGDEGEPRAWKRFDDNAQLTVDYVPDPGVPINVGVIPGVAKAGSRGYCHPASDPLAVTVDQPTVRARVETEVSPRANDSKGKLKINYRIARLEAGAWEEIWADDAPDSGYVPDGTLLDKQTTKRTDGTTYRYRARTQSHWSYNGASGDLYSSFSPWCYFVIDSTAPKAPTIEPKDPVKGSPYVECVTDACNAKGGPGVAGSFVFKPNAADEDISKYRWTLTGPNGQVGAARTTTAKANGTAEVTTVTPTMGGTHHLKVWPMDVRERTGTPETFDFQVSLPPGPIGRWRFDDGAPGSGVTTAKDSSAEDPQHDPSAATHNLTLRDGAGFSTMARRGDEDTSLWLDSTDPDLQQAYAAASAPVVNTAHSFTVSAWTYLTDASSSRMVLAAPGTQAQAFALYYSSSSRSYVFHYTATDSATPVFVRSVGAATDPPLRVWTHVAGVYTAATDASGKRTPQNDTIQLFVNGRAQGEPVKLLAVAPSYKPWEAGQGLQVGRSIVRGTAGQYFRGRIDEVAVWQSALSADEVAKEAKASENDAPTVELVADWNAENSSGAAVSESSPYPIGAMTLSSGAILDEDSSTLVLDGKGGHASMTGPAIDETGSFTVSAQAQIDPAVLDTKPNGYQAQIAGQAGSGGASWALVVKKLGQGAYVWKFLRTTSSGTTVATADVTNLSEHADTSSPVTLTGVYDAQDQGGRMHLYVGATPVDDGDNNAATTPQQGTGRLAMGGTSASSLFAGQLSRLRIWTGAMTRDEVRSRVISSD